MADMAPAAPVAAPVSSGNSSNSVTSSTPSNSHSTGVSPPGTSSQTTPTTPSQPEYFEVKIDGKPVKMTRQELIDNASMAYTANNRFIEAKKMRGEYESLTNKIKSDPLSALLDPNLGLSKEQVRERFEKWYFDEVIAPEQMNDDQRRARDYERQIESYKKKEEEQNKIRATQEEERLVSQNTQYFQQKIIEALESSQLPKDDYFASRMAFYMSQNLKNGWDAPPDMIARQVEKEFRDRIQKVSSNSTAEQLIKLLGDDIIDKLMTHRLQKLREKRTIQPASPKGSNQPNGKFQYDPNEKIYTVDVNERLNKFRREGF